LLVSACEEGCWELCAFDGADGIGTGTTTVGAPPEELGATMLEVEAPLEVGAPLEPG
jgi:hypothetical protein